MQIETGSRHPFLDLQSLLGSGRRFGIAKGEAVAPLNARDSRPSVADPLQNFRSFENTTPAARIAPTSIRSRSPSELENSLVSRSTSMREETSLSLELTTREGDVVSLNFRQADFASSETDQTGFSAQAGVERYVSMSVVGELSEEELSAIDGFIAKVAEEASELMDGDLGAAAMRLASMGFESDALASFALDFRQSSYQLMTSVYSPRGEQGLADLACRDCGIADFLRNIADMQRRLIDDAKSLFADVDAARLGRSVVPAALRFVDV